jgi:crotonobetainyl-CoA:carnitine CoA-transferase CaiB-like acyl-CoA transferase
VLAGLIQRDRKGVPVEAKVSLLAAVLEIQMQEITTHLTRGSGADRGSAPYASVWMEPPYGIYGTSDGFIALAQADLTELATSLASDRLATHVQARPEAGERAAHQEWRDTVYIIVSECLAPLSTEDAVARLEGSGIWCGPVLDYDELAAHPQAEGLFADVAFKNATLRTLAPAINFTGHDTAELRSPPTLGEHSAEILGAIGLSDDEIDTLRKTGVTL